MSWEGDEWRLYELFDPVTFEKSPPTTGIFQFPQRRLLINVEWFKWVDAFIERGLWGDCYTERRDFAIDELKKMLANNEAIMLRQNPDEPCKLQMYDLDTQTWVDTFDYSLCLSGMATNIENNYTLNIQDSLNQVFQDIDIWNGDYRNIAPNWEYGTGTITDAERDNTMCYGLHEVIHAICDAILEAKTEGKLLDAWLEISKIAMSVVSGLLATLGGIATGNLALIAFGGSTAAALAAALFDLFQGGGGNLDSSIYANDTYREEIVCCAFSALEGTSPTYTAWSNALSSCGFSGEVEQLRLEIAEVFVKQEFYVQWLKIMDALLDAVAAIGATLPCVCNSEWLCTWDFSVDDYDFDFIPGAAVFSIGNGWQRGTVEDSRITLKYNGGGMPFQLNRARATMTLPMSGNAQLFRLRDWPSGSEQANFSGTSQAEITLPAYQNWNSATYNVDIVGDWDSSGTPIPGYLRKLEVWGTGVPPPTGIITYL